MKERPILFSTEMVQAIIDGRKTETRRVAVPVKDDSFDGGFKFGHGYSWTSINYPKIANYSKYGTSGDVLWVRETWAKHDGELIFKADWAHDEITHNNRDLTKGLWKPSIHMPKAAARIWLQVEEIRVERLQDITEESAIKEGIIDYQDGTYKNYFTQKGLREQDGVDCILPKGSFQSLWCSINGPDSWDANPWVWVVKFKVLSTTGKPNFLNQ